MTALEERKKADSIGFGCIFAFGFLITQLLIVAPRLSSIVLFAYVFGYYVIIAFVVHWLALMLTILLIEISGGCSETSFWFHF